MIVFLTIFYLILCFIYLILKPKKKKACFLTQNGKQKKVYKCFNNKFLFFCSRKSFQFEIINLAIKSQICFKSEKDYLKIVEPLKNCGVDVTKCLYKIELYKNFNVESVFLKLNAFKKLQQKGYDFNLFIFVNDYKLLKSFLKIIDAFKFKNSSVVRVVHCLEVDYKVLCAINFLNLFEAENIYLLNSKMGNLKQLKMQINSCCNLNKKELNNIKIFENSCVLSFENFEYKNYCFESKITNGLVEYSLLKTYDFDYNCFVFKLVIKNNSFNFLPIKFNIGTFFNKIIPKNAIYVIKTNNNFVCLSDKVLNKKINILAKKLYVAKDKNQDILVLKNIIVNPQTEQDFYFALFEDEQNLKDFADEKMIKTEQDLKNIFYSCVQKYVDINLVKIKSQNNIVDNLINSYLPQKIIKNFILQPKKYSFDFYNLVNKNFDAKLVNKDIVNGNLSKFYLTNTNLFSAYQNLIYFYGGAYCDKIGINLNLDKSLIFNNSKINFLNNKQVKTLTFKNNNLKGEVKINNIIYSNLKFLSFDNLKDDLEIYY